MGKATIIRDSAKELDGISAQTLQMAQTNGVMANVTDIDLSNPNSPSNRPHIVNNTTWGVPADLSIGVQQTFHSGTNRAILLITGLTTSNRTAIWARLATKSGVNVVLSGSDWNLLTVNNDTFTGATSSAAGTGGLVPAPGAGYENATLMGDGTWKKPDPSVDKYVTGMSTQGSAIILHYNTGESEVLTKLSETQYKVELKNAEGTTTRTFNTTLDSANNISVVVS